MIITFEDKNVIYSNYKSKFLTKNCILRLKLVKILHAESFHASRKIY